MSLLACRNASFAYDGRTVLEDVSFEVSAGGYLCIVGENGAGKSTLMQGLLGLVRPVGGSVEVDADVRAGGIGYLPQQTAVQKDFPASVEEVVLSGQLRRCGLRPFYSRGDRLEAEAKLRMVQMQGFKKKCFRDLSGGQQRRVLLARALCATRSLLLLDEPAAGLDPRMQDEMYQILNGLNREQGMTIVMITHDVQSALRCARQILHLNGRQLFFGAAAEYQNSAAGRRFIEGAAFGVSPQVPAPAEEGGQGLC